MPSIFGAAPRGTVLQVDDGHSTGTIQLLKTTGLSEFGGGNFVSEKIIVTSFSADEAVNVQFNHTMGNDIYMNVFGNRMGTFSLRGIAFNSASQGQGCPNDNGHGILNVIRWYRENRASSFQTPEITLNLKNEAPFSGYLIAANYSANNPADYMVEYVLTIATVPR